MMEFVRGGDHRRSICLFESKHRITVLVFNAAQAASLLRVHWKWYRYANACAPLPFKSRDFLVSESISVLLCSLPISSLNSFSAVPFFPAHCIQLETVFQSRANEISKQWLHRNTLRHEIHLLRFFFIADSLCLGLMWFIHGQNREKERWMRNVRQNEISDALKCINPLSVEEHTRERIGKKNCLSFVLQFNWIRGHTIALDPNLI